MNMITLASSSQYWKVHQKTVSHGCSRRVVVVRVHHKSTEGKGEPRGMKQPGDGVRGGMFSNKVGG